MRSVAGGFIGALIALLFMNVVAPDRWGNYTDTGGAPYNNSAMLDGRNLHLASGTWDLRTCDEVLLPTTTIETVLKTHRVQFTPGLTNAERNALESTEDDISVYSVLDETALMIFENDTEREWVQTDVAIDTILYAFRDNQERSLEVLR
jgi:hypothetical protein